MSCRLCASEIPDEWFRSKLESEEFRYLNGGIHWNSIRHRIREEFSIRNLTHSDLKRHIEHVDILPESDVSIDQN